MLNGSGDLADRADRVTKCAQAAAAEALEASKEANDWHNHLRGLVIKLQMAKPVSQLAHQQLHQPG
jgi:hypothetical protein